MTPFVQDNYTSLYVDDDDDDVSFCASASLFASMGSARKCLNSAASQASLGQKMGHCCFRLSSKLTSALIGSNIYAKLWPTGCRMNLV